MDEHRARTGPATLDRPTPGARLLDRYVLGPLLGAGAHGSVHRAEDVLLGRPVAVKILPGALAEDPARVRREIAALRLLHLPGAVRLLDEATVGEDVVLVLELIEGAPFPGAPTPMPWAALATRALALAETVARLHAAGVVHRDLKPANVLVDAQGRVVVVDFGLSAGPALGGALTGPGEVVGTPEYMAPEQLLGERVDVGADLYALGVMLYEALSGDVPHGGGAVDLVRRRVLEHVPPLADVAPDVPAPIADLVDRMLARDPRARPSSAARVGAALAGGAIPGGAEELPWLAGESVVMAIVAAARAGRGALIVGGPGAGKTRLLAAVAEQLGAAGIVVHRVGRSGRPLGSLRRLWGEPGGAHADLDAVLAAQAARARACLEAGEVCLVDEGDPPDRWSARILRGLTSAGPIVEATTTPDAADPRPRWDLEPLGERDLHPLFQGPDRLFHLVTDGAHLLHRRTGGHPGRVAAEVQAWIRVGLARWDGGRLAIGRDDLERLTSGAATLLGPERSVSEGSGAGRAGFLADVEAWLSLAAPRVPLVALAQAMERPTWEIEAAVRDLAAEGVVDFDGARVEVRQISGGPRRLSGNERAQAHAALARALPRGASGRLSHLVLAPEQGADRRARTLPEEALALGQRRLAEGRVGAALRALGDALAALRALAAPSETGPGEEALLRAWVLAALQDGTPHALDRALYEIFRATAPSAATAHLGRLASAALDTFGEDAARAYARVGEVPPFADLELERARLGLLVRSARRVDAATQIEATRLLSAWGHGRPEPGPRASALAAEARLSYRRGAFADAARLHLAAAELEPLVSGRIDETFRAAASLMETFAHDEAAACARRARDAARASRHPRAEAWAEWALRAAEYRAGHELVPDEALLAAIALLGQPELTPLVALTEAAIALRASALAPALRWALDARDGWRALGLLDNALLAEALAIGLGHPLEAAALPDMVARAGRCPVTGLGVQVLGLLARGGARLGDEDRRLARALAGEVPRPMWSRRIDVLSVAEALALVDGVQSTGGDVFSSGHPAAGAPTKRPPPGAGSEAALPRGLGPSQGEAMIWHEKLDWRLWWLTGGGARGPAPTLAALAGAADRDLDLSAPAWTLDGERHRYDGTTLHGVEFDPETQRPSLRVLVELATGAPPGLDAPQLGFDDGWIDGRFAVGRVPAHRLAALASLPYVRRVELSRPLRFVAAWPGRHAVGSRAIDDFRGVDPADAIGVPPPDLLGAPGAGVLVGIVDNVLDPRVTALRDGGETCVVSYWFQGDTTPGRAPPGFRSGTLYTRADLQRELDQGGVIDPRHLPDLERRPKDGHGTSVACIVAGRGPGYRGVAAAAGLVFVAAQPSGPDALGDSAALGDAVHFIDAEATRLGMPCAINISLGDGLGPHDGSTVAEQYLAEVAGRAGRVIVVCAGNARVGKHASGTLSAEGLRLVAATLVPSPPETIDVWYEGPGDAVLTLVPLVGEPIGPFSGADGIRFHPSFEHPMVSVEATPPAATRWGVFRIRLQRGRLLAPGELHLRVEAAPGTPLGRRVHAWIDDTESPYRLDPHPDDEQSTVTTPGTADGVLTVGACEFEPAGSAHPSRVWPRSGAGPTLGAPARPKPEILAVGGGLAVVMPLPDGGSEVNNRASGTSLAAPLVTGAAALILATRPEASTAAVSATLVTAGVPTDHLPPRLAVRSLFPS
jgi:subtilisin family serine protease